MTLTWGLVSGLALDLALGLVLGSVSGLALETVLDLSSTHRAPKFPTRDPGHVVKPWHMLWDKHSLNSVHHVQGEPRKFFTTCNQNLAKETQSNEHKCGNQGNLCKLSSRQSRASVCTKETQEKQRKVSLFISFQNPRFNIINLLAFSNLMLATFDLNNENKKKALNQFNQPPNIIQVLCLDRKKKKV